MQVHGCMCYTEQQANIWDAIQNIMSVICSAHLNLIVQENMY